MRRLLAILLFFIVHIGCNNQTIDNPASNNENVYFISKVEFKAKQLDYCEVINYEVIDLYEFNDSMSDESKEFLHLDDYLKEEGFEIKSSSRGNWMEGSRIVVLELIKNDCNCRVVKKYWDKKNGETVGLITEQLICNSDVVINFNHP